MIGLPLPPTSLHWLGDRESAEETRHAQDARGCVMYFETAEQCQNFMCFVALYPALMKHPNLEQEVKESDK